VARACKPLPPQGFPMVAESRQLRCCDSDWGVVDAHAAAYT
jgi:hypothetical protein